MVKVWEQEAKVVQDGTEGRAGLLVGWRAGVLGRWSGTCHAYRAPTLLEPLQPVSFHV